MSPSFFLRAVGGEKCITSESAVETVGILQCLKNDDGTERALGGCLHREVLWSPGGIKGVRGPVDLP